MKRIIVLALAACMVLGAALGASAAEFKASGFLYAGYDYMNFDNTGKADGDRNAFSQRFRSQINIVASENLYGVVYFEIDQDWGQSSKSVEQADGSYVKIGNVGGGSGGAIGADGVNVETKRAYVNFLVPSTTINVRAGIQGVALPGAVSGSPILNDDVAGIVASSAVSGVNVTGIFARPYDDIDSSETTLDLFGAVLAADLGPATVSPYALFALNGSSSDVLDDNDAYWIGAAVNVAPIANITFDFDAVYGKESGKDAGFLVAGKAAYAADFAVPAVLAWYASGNDTDGEGQMATTSGNSGNSFVPTTLVGYGAAATSTDALFGNALGKWGVSLQVSELTYIEKLTHTARVSYIRGTNDDDITNADIETWTEDDAAFELDFVSTYAVYENLDFIVDLAYVACDFDSTATKDTDSVFKAAAGVKYNF